MHTTTTSPSQPEPFRSSDSLVYIGVHPNPRRFPAHDYPCVIVRLTPASHERIRTIQHGVEWMPTLLEIKSLMVCLQAAHPTLNLCDHQQLVNKPEERKFYWKKVNHDRVRAMHRRRHS